MAAALPILLLVACTEDPAHTGIHPDDSPTDSPPDTSGDSPGGDTHGADSHADTGGDTHGADSHADTGGDTGTPPEPEPFLRFVGSPPTNVLVISVDTMRRDQVGTWSGLDTTPTLDAILAEGVILEDHRSCSNWTAPSMLCAMNGRSPLADDFFPTAVYDVYNDTRVAGIPSGLPSLASALRAEGYHTGLVTSNNVISSYNTPNIVEGFDIETSTGWAAAPTTVAYAKDMVEQLDAYGTPWFLHIHFLDPHGPYAAPVKYSYELEEIDPGYEFPFDVTDASDVYSLFAYWPYLTDEEVELARQYLFAVYHGEFRYWDAGLDLLWDVLDRGGYLDDTLVVFYADHGEQFGEHDQFQHGKDLFSEENRVPAGFWARNIVPGTWAGPTDHVDIAPTVLDTLGLEPVPEHEGVVVGLADEDRARVSFCYLPGYCSPMMSVVKGDAQLVYLWEGGKRFLFDLSADPDTTDDIYDASDPRYEELWAVLQPEIMAVQERWPFMVAVDAEP